MPPRQRPRRRLAPGQIAEELFCLDPDRDERAPQLCAETLLTLVQNGYKAPATPISCEARSASDSRYAASRWRRTSSAAATPAARATTRRPRPSTAASSPEAAGSGTQHNLQLAQLTMQGLVDPDTQRGQKGAWLLRPFHESLLWYDARRPGPNSLEYSVRKVYMRGSGITLARLLTSPPDPRDAELGESAVAAIQEALTLSSPLADISVRLESALPPGEVYNRPPDLEQDEQDAWEKGADPRLADLAPRICRHAEGVMLQGGASGPAKLWQLRTILALDLAVHVLQTAWAVTGAPAEERYLLLSLGQSHALESGVAALRGHLSPRPDPAQRGDGPDARPAHARTQRRCYRLGVRVRAAQRAEQRRGRQCQQPARPGSPIPPIPRTTCGSRGLPWRTPTTAAPRTVSGCCSSQSGCWQARATGT